MLKALDVEDVEALSACGAEIRAMVRAAPLPEALKAAIAHAFEEIGGHSGLSFAVRSSATAEDLPEASFAGQQETLLNVKALSRLFAAISARSSAR
jgi:pyruvate,water dikinase